MNHIQLIEGTLGHHTDFLFQQQGWIHDHLGSALIAIIRYNLGLGVSSINNMTLIS